MIYPLDQNPQLTANYRAYLALLEKEKGTIEHLGSYLDATFNAIWYPPAPATVQGVIDLCGPSFLARCQLHAALATLLLGMEAANGVDSSKHPWAKKQADGSFTSGLPEGWTVAPNADATKAPIATFVAPPLVVKLEPPVTP